MKRGRPAGGVSKKLPVKKISKQDKKDLRTLAGDFGLLHRADVQEIIQTCESYVEGQRRIMKIYEAVYM